MSRQTASIPVTRGVGTTHRPWRQLSHPTISRSMAGEVRSRAHAGGVPEGGSGLLAARPECASVARTRGIRLAATVDSHTRQAWILAPYRCSVVTFLGSRGTMGEKGFPNFRQAVEGCLGRHSNQIATTGRVERAKCWCPQRDSNPRYRLEGPMS